MKKNFTILLVIPLFFGVVAFAQKSLWEPQKERMYALEDVPGIIPDGEKIKPSLLGFDNFFGALYWLKSLQYMGGNFGEETPAIFSLLDVTTDLNPYMEMPYFFGMLQLPDQGKMDEVEALIQKAEDANMMNWRLLYQAGYFNFFYKEDNEKAIEYFERCVEKQGCLVDASTSIIKALKVRAGKYPLAIQTYLTDLQNPDLSDEEYQLAKKKIIQAADLMFLNDAVQQYHLSGKDVNAIEDLKNFSFIPQNQQMLAFLQNLQQKNVVDLGYQISQNSITVNTAMLTTPFENNPYQWNEEKQKIRTKQF